MTEFSLDGTGWSGRVDAAGVRWAFRGRGRRGEVVRPGRRPEKLSFDDPLPVLRRLLKEGAPRRPAHPLDGAAFGYFGYEAFAPPAERKLRGPSAVPDFFWVRPETCIVGERPSGGSPGFKASVKNPGPGFRRGDGQKRYEKGVRRILGYIAAGDVYQANLSHTISLTSRGLGPRRYFDALRALNPSPYACFMDFGGFVLASSSPELLLRVRGGRAETRPIAGTRPRGRDARQDRRLSGELLLNPKERAEHVMLLDLERNDLGRVCRPGSVRVTESLALEKYSHVTHIVSQVEGRLSPGSDSLDAFRALFPGGTITGCPKVHCMEILADLERSPRGPFYGSAGWIAPNGDCELNILIRTALFREGTMSLRAGAGIVADSDPRREWEETLHKAEALLAARESVR
jgi:anthranilate/para-aminobenzoate synthase component I